MSKRCRFITMIGASCVAAFILFILVKSEAAIINSDNPFFTYPKNIGDKILVGTVSDTILTFYLSKYDSKYIAVNSYQFKTGSPFWICLPYGGCVNAAFKARCAVLNEQTGDTAFEYTAILKDNIAKNTSCLIHLKPFNSFFPFDTSSAFSNSESMVIKNWVAKTTRAYTTELLDILASYQSNLDTVITYPQKYIAIKLSSQSQHKSFYIIYFIHSLSYAKGYSSVALIKIVDNKVFVIFEKHSISSGDVFMGYTYEAMFPSESKGNALLLIKDNRDDYHINLIYSFDPATEKVSKVLEYAQ